MTDPLLKPNCIPRISHLIGDLDHLKEEVLHILEIKQRLIAEVYFLKEYIEMEKIVQTN